MQIDHGKNGTALGNVGQGDHRPEHGAVVVGDQLQVDGVGHVMQPRDDERSIDKAKDSGEHLTEGVGDTAEHHAGNERTMAQPMGPRTKCAAHTASTRLQKGTTIICTTVGTRRLKKRSR